MIWRAPKRAKNRTLNSTIWSFEHNILFVIFERVAVATIIEISHQIGYSEVLGYKKASLNEQRGSGPSWARTSDQKIMSLLL